MTSLSVSIIITTYNYGHYIQRAIKSVLSQNYNCDLMQIVVIDDGSADNTKEILQPFIEKKIIEYYYQQNLGKAAATHKGIELATGDIFFNLDADDWFLPQKIERVVTAFLKYPRLSHVATPALIIEEPFKANLIEKIPEYLINNVLPGLEVLRYFFENNIFFGGGSTFAARTDVLKKIKWSEQIDMYTDEWLVIQTSGAGDMLFLSDPLSVWNVHGKNYSAGKRDGSQLRKKYNRLEHSSLAILRLLESGNYPIWLIELYQLKHQVRKIMFQEELGERIYFKIFYQISRLVLSGKYRTRTLISYHLLNRLAPTYIIKIARKCKNILSRQYSSKPSFN